MWEGGGGNLSTCVRGNIHNNFIGQSTEKPLYPSVGFTLGLIIATCYMVSMCSIEIIYTFISLKLDSWVSPCFLVKLRNYAPCLPRKSMNTAVMKCKMNS